MVSKKELINQLINKFQSKGLEVPYRFTYILVDVKFANNLYTKYTVYFNVRVRDEDVTKIVAGVTGYKTSKALGVDVLVVPVKTQYEDKAVYLYSIAQEIGLRVADAAYQTLGRKILVNGQNIFSQAVYEMYNAADLNDKLLEGGDERFVFVFQPMCKNNNVKFPIEVTYVLERIDQLKKEDSYYFNIYAVAANQSKTKYIRINTEYSITVLRRDVNRKNGMVFVHASKETDVTRVVEQMHKKLYNLAENCGLEGNVVKGFHIQYNVK